jgi:hypothetical protein
MTDFGKSVEVGVVPKQPPQTLLPAAVARRLPDNIEGSTR